MARSNSFEVLALTIFWTVGVAAQPQASVTGSVTNAVSGLPIVRAHVTLRGGAQVLGCLTDAEGKFSIGGLAPGEYFVTAERTGFVPNRPFPRPNSVSLKAGDTKDGIEVKLTPVGAVVGRIVDADGEPVQAVHVSARGMGTTGDATTDDKGRYRIGGLEPGRYRVKAWIDWRNLPPETRTDGSKEVRYAPTFYPGVISSKDATRVTVQAGGESSGIDIHLVGSPVVKVSGKVLNLPAESKAVFVEVMQQEGAGMSMGTGMRASRANSTFVLWGISPGKVTLTARAANSADMDLQSAAVELEVGTDNVENIELRLVPAFDVSGSLRFEDERARQAPSATEEGSRKNMKRRLIASPVGWGNQVEAEIADDKSFRLEKLQPGQYRVELEIGGYVKSMRLGSQEIDGDIVDLRYGAMGPLTVVVSTATGEITGMVSDSKGPVAGATVVVMAENGQGATMTTTDASGKYSVDGLRPAKYHLLAAEAGAEDLVMRPDTLEDIDDLVTVELRSGDKVTQDLKKRVPDQ